MQTGQVQLALNTAIQQAIADPSTANLTHLLQMVEQSLVQLPQEAQLRVAGELLYQLAEVCAARAIYLLEDWEEKHNPCLTEPILTATMLQEVLRHSMTLNLDGVLEEASPQPWASQPAESVIAELDKSSLLELLNHLDQEQAKQKALDVAHNEDVSAWIQAIAAWMQNHSQEISLLELQQSLQMPLVEVWLALLLGGYRVEQRGEFYQVEAVWVSLPNH